MRVPIFLLSTSRQNLGRLLLIRILVLAAQAGPVGFAWFSDLLPLLWLAFGLTLGLSACLILFTVLHLRAPWPAIDQEYAVQLACDLIIHNTLLYYSGGSTNPFISYYPVSLTIVAATLPWIYSMVLSGLALTGYTLLLVWYHPLHLQAVQHEAMLINLHLFGMWLNFALSAAFITFFVVEMSEMLRWQAHMQAERREESMRGQQSLAVAIQAASAAHEPGTPLATMSVLLDELRQERPQDPTLQEDLALLQERVKRCKHTLQQLIRTAETDRRQAIEGQSAAEWLESVLRRQHLMHPEASHRYQCLGPGSAPRLTPPTDLSQALLSLLNNAADACPDDLDIRLDWDSSSIYLSIHDRGIGVPLAIAEQIGKPFFTIKGKGFGLGLFLSQASVTRAGGTVKSYDHEDGGTLTELRLPRSYGMA